MIDPALIRGAVELERTDRGLLPHRLPAWARAQTDDPQLHLVEVQPSGVRLALRTTATRLELDVLPTKRRYPGTPPRPDGSYDVLVDGDGHDWLIKGDEGNDVVFLGAGSDKVFSEQGNDTIYVLPDGFVDKIRCTTATRTRATRTRSSSWAGATRSTSSTRSGPARSCS